MKKAVMVIAHEGFRDEELLQPKAALEKAGIAVEVCSTDMSEATGKLGAKVMPDCLMKDIDVASYDALIFIGGPGSVAYWDDVKAHALLRDAAAQGKIVAAICSAGVTLARSGVTRGKRSTVWAGDAVHLKAAGVNYTGKPVERDGAIITASGPAAAAAFGDALVKALKK